MQIYKILSSIAAHPMNAGHKTAAVGRFVKWQLASRLSNTPITVKFVNDTVLVLGRHAHGGSGNIYYGLAEWVEMAFALHMLRPGDVFVDVGANLGAYTVLAAGAAKAHVVSFEPIPATLANLRRNVVANRLESRVEICGCGVGARPGFLTFTDQHDTTNRVALPGDRGLNIEITTLDNVLATRAATLIKIDVEGFEMSVLEGAHAALSSPDLLALIIEINPQVEDYGFAADSVEKCMTSYGFELVSYDPIRRALVPAAGPLQNGIFVRDKAAVTARLASAARFKTQAREI
jgi:FkbM family methyltransferase